jgi:hypothetical protein
MKTYLPFSVNADALRLTLARNVSISAEAAWGISPFGARQPAQTCATAAE